MNKKGLIASCTILLALSIIYPVFANNIGGSASSKEDIMIVADQKYYWGPEGNAGRSIFGKFNSSKLMKETLNLSEVIGLFKSKKWTLSDILISIDLNANGDVATWIVSGPKPLLLCYLKKLKNRYQDKTLFYDFSYTFIECKPIAYLEQEEQESIILP